MYNFPKVDPVSNPVTAFIRLCKEPIYCALQAGPLCCSIYRALKSDACLTESIGESHADKRVACG